MNDIDLSVVSSWSTGNERYGGRFDGNGYTISNLSSTTQGLFNSIGQNVSIKDLNLKNFNITVASTERSLQIGPLANIMEGGWVQNVHVIGGTIKNSSTSYYWTGGLIGEVNGGIPDASYSVCDYRTATIKDSSSSANVSGGDAVGGLFGWICSSGCEVTIDNCWASGSVTESYNYGAGGLVGEILVYGTSSGAGTVTITNSYATGNVSGTESVGGFIGLASTSVAGDKIIIKNCWSSGYAASSGDIVGGFIGETEGYNTNSKVEIYNSYSLGSANGKQYVGGFIGYSSNTYVSNSFSAGTISGSSSLGGFDGYSSGTSYSACHFNSSTSDSGSGLTGHAASWWTEKNIYDTLGVQLLGYKAQGKAGITGLSEAQAKELGFVAVKTASELV